MPRESLKNKIARTKKIIKLLKKNYPNAKCSLNYKTVHQLMVATILSAQCTDERVNATTPALFKKYRSIKNFAESNLKELGTDIYSTGFHNSKAKSIKNSAMMLLEDYRGKIPKTLEELIKLPGVGRKTGSVVLGEGFGLAEGIVVDTHVGRISRHLSLTKEQDPAKVEKDLMKIIPYADWIIFTHLMIDHGRAICKARKPDCGNCFLKELCVTGEKFL